MMTPLAPSIPSTSTPSSSSGGVTLKAFMAQLEHMDAFLDTLTTQLYQVNTRISRITRRQAHMGGFTASPSPEASEDEDADDVSGDDDEDEDASSSSVEEMTASE